MQVTELLNELDNYILDNKNIYKFVSKNSIAKGLIRLIIKFIN